jgi:hypothetical protein
MLIGSAARVLFISLIDALLQNLDWVRARVLAIFILVYQGSFALGSAVWGAVAQRAGIRVVLIYADIGTIRSTVFALFAKLPNSTEDLSPWNHLRMPVAVEEVAVIREREAEFVKASINMPIYDVVMVRIDGGFSVIPKPQITIWRYSW